MNRCLFVTFEVRVLGKSLDVDKNVILQLLIGSSSPTLRCRIAKSTQKKIIFIFTKGAVKTSNAG